ncbi:hypothetical protein KSD_06180 [Ktedonobacter sp. SOSP1-85]|uniref:sensor histidine kinase n=1 Tax=Ktedonobacter sp. SOSP1-85 TaxID=2778367 RepID=UPI00191548DA|nr:ATP-binding protein [Ktedonobacter sp. SOSP1-85]GHO72847.1 hypothetical protein KSD_06180 [Ktedonobacter sp. SOSP1-85]
MHQRFPQLLHSNWISPQQLDAWWTSLPVASIIWDQTGKILSLNPVACTLFEVSVPHTVVGSSIQAFFQRYAWSDEQHLSFLFVPWLLDLTTHRDSAISQFSTQSLRLGLPSGRTVLLELQCAPVLDAQGQLGGVLAVFQEVPPRYQRALHLQRTYEAVVAFNEVIAHLPEQLAMPFSEAHLLLSPLAHLVGQPLVDVIHATLACWRVALIALRLPSIELAYAVGSGFTEEQERRRREIGNYLNFPAVVGDTGLAGLYANQEVIFGSDRIPFSVRSMLGIEATTILAVPLTLEQQLAGVLIIHKQGWDCGYTQEEVDLVHTVVAQASLLIEWLGTLYKKAEAQVREVVLSEVSQLSNNFLTLASHELRTPLTGIKGNLQIAQRRLIQLKQTLAEQSVHLEEHLERAQRALVSAEQSAQLQERMIQDMIDDAQIQTNQLHLTLQPCDLLTVIKTTVRQQQEALPTHVIMIDNRTLKSTIPVLADVSRISKVLTIYLANALTSPPAEKPVTVQIQEMENVVRVSVQDEGPGIPLEEQSRIWERFYRGKGTAVQHELDLSLGLSFYLCREIIEHHQGHTGVESEPGRGATFWFILPKAISTSAY